MEGAVLTFPLEQDTAENRSVSSPRPAIASGKIRGRPGPLDPDVLIMLSSSLLQFKNHIV
ncbi:MAG: hypothetical protein CBC13_11820 [Planctomycetia bacterium TMED53]|nr:MAG: hypothetical protein CBC13_11820 [Planctomycetia bacterium TMED53]